MTDGLGSRGRNVLRATLGNAAAPVLSLVSAPVLAHALGVDGRGEVAAGMAPLLLALSVATMGLPEAITYTVAGTRAPLRRALVAAGLGLVGSGAVACVLTVVFRDVLSDSHAGISSLILLAACAIVPCLLLSLVRAVAAGLGAWGHVARENLLGAAARLAGLLVLLATGGLDARSAVLVLAFAPLVGGLSYLTLGRRLRATPAVPDAAPGTAGAGRLPALLGYGSRVWFGTMSGVLLMRLDQLVMTPLSSAYELGLYAVAASVSEVPLIFNSAVRDVTFAADSRESRDALLVRSARISGALCLVAAGGIAVTLPVLLPALFGAGFAAAVPITWVLLLAVALGPPGSVAGAALAARGRPGLRSTSLLVASVLNGVLLFVLVPPMGAMGAAVATLVGNVVASNLNIYFCRRHFGMRFWSFYALSGADVRAITARFGRLTRSGGRHRTAARRPRTRV